MRLPAKGKRRIKNGVFLEEVGSFSQIGDYIPGASDREVKMMFSMVVLQVW